MFERLRTAVGDPTEAWPDASGALPPFDWSELRLGPLAFGDPLGAAEPLGRPDTFRWTQPGYCELLYARAGFQLGFDPGGFAYLAWFIAPDPLTPELPEMSGCTPSLDDDLILSRDTRVHDLRERLGPPTSEDSDADEIVLFYTGGGIVLEFEFDGGERLKRVNLYPQAD